MSTRTITYRDRVLTIPLLFISGLLVANGGCATGGVNDETGNGGTGGGTVGGGHPGGDGGTAGEGGGSACATDCSSITVDQCSVARCNESTGQCYVEYAPDGTECDDGLFCTIDDSCYEGVCGSDTQNDCGETPLTCNEIVCNESSQSCTNQPLPDGNVCVSDDLCVVNATCSSGGCSGSAKDCTFAPVPDDCHVSECNPLSGDCEPVVGNEGGSCDDPNDLCTENKTCVSGVCSGGSAVDCSHLTSGCNVGICDTTSGDCTTQTAGQGQICDDLDGCTTGETCDNGVCGGGTPVTTCSLTGDGCCPSTCTETNDYDCACPGTFVNGTCVYLANPNGLTLTNAQSTCQALGTGWALCSPTILCDTQTLTYLGTHCDCNLGSAYCACGSSANLYIHTSGTSPYYIRTSLVPNCDWASDACTSSVSETCGAALCCK